MAMKKAEMEEHHTKYCAIMAEARALYESRLYAQAVELALASWEYIDGMMQYERRYKGNGELRSISAIEMVLKVSPLLFHRTSLGRVGELLKSQRRIEKNTSADIGDRLEQARALMWDAHRLWEHLERLPDARQDELRQNLGGDQDRWRRMAETWEEMGVVRRTPEGGSYRLALATRMDEAVFGKCPACGVVGKAEKGKLINNIKCPKCRNVGTFVILARRPA